MSLADDLYMLICQLLCCGCNLFMCTLAWSQLKSAFEWYICSSGAAERDGRRLVINIPKSLLFYTEPRLNSHKNITGNIFQRRKSTVSSSYLQLLCISLEAPAHMKKRKKNSPHTPLTRFSRPLSCQSSAAEEEETRSDGGAAEFPAPAAGSPILHYGLIKDKHRRGLILCAETRSSLK